MKVVIITERMDFILKQASGVEDGSPSHISVLLSI